jgi:hypothetical protein
MKKLFSILLSAVISFAANAQTAVIVPLDATGSGVSGGDGTGKIVSATWAGVDLPAPAPFVDSTGKAGTNQGLVTYVAINKVGTYNFELTIKDNRGTVTKGTMQVIAKEGQHTIIIFVKPIVTVYLQ